MKVSILIATHGDGKWERLANERALPSALALVQAGHEGEIIQRHYADETLAGARNRAAALATGEWLLNLDADDELEPGYLEAMRRALAFRYEQTVAAVYPPAPLLVPRLRRVQCVSRRTLNDWWADFDPKIPNEGRWPRLNECVIGTLVRRDLFVDVGGFRDETTDGTPISMYEDWDLWLRCYDAGARLIYTDAVYRAHVNPAGRNTNAHEAQVVYDAIWRDHLQRIVDEVPEYPV